MNIEDIIATKERLNTELRYALSTMEKSDKIKEIRQEIQKNQMACPHYSSKFNWTWTENKCPYCGKVIQSRSE